ncbi:hypothetical protein [Streptomyces mexicanus]|uniref:hypothetical protein n=1 Tax=Streptomyces mexicanus TaxID=178566 RepID=UPI003649FFFC
MMRWPSGDQPGAGGNVRGITGPTSSAQTTVAPSGGQASQWHTLPSNALPTGEDVFTFPDARVQQVPREAAQAGLTPRDDTELLAALLDLVGARSSVDS